MTLAVARSVTKKFGSFTAVRGVDLTIDDGEIVGLIGANGAGKTTLIRMLLGLELPTEGSIELFGEPPSKRTRSRIGYVPQGLGLYEELTVEENLSFAAAAFGVVPEHPWDLRPFLTTPVGELSLGLRRRLAFAAAFQHRPDLVVLDEPTSGVDVLGRAALWDTIRSAAESGSGVLVTTHHMEEAEQCDRLVMMAAGSVVASGTADEIVGDARSVEVVTRDWTEAFDVLEAAGLTVALVGNALRVAGADLENVRQLLSEAGLAGRMRMSPATLDETFAVLAARAELFRQLETEQVGPRLSRLSIAKAAGFAATAVLLASGTFFVNRTANEEPAGQKGQTQQGSRSSSESPPTLTVQSPPTASPSPPASVPAVTPGIPEVPAQSSGAAPRSQNGRQSQRVTRRAAPANPGPVPAVLPPAPDAAPASVASGSTVSSSTHSITLNGFTLKNTFVSSSSSPPAGTGREGARP